MSSNEAITNRIKSTILKHQLISDGDAILVALSGGADSVCMLDLLVKLKDELNIKVAAAHLNHMIRGAEADRDEAYAAELCTKLSVPFFAERVNVPEISQKYGISEELAGRNARYEFLKRICAEKGYNKIATAHNRNDRAETLLMRIIRGTGIDGLASIKYKREDGVIRPILDIERYEIEKYCTENNLSYCHDSTNSDNEYTRNRIRNELIPFLEEKFNPSIIDSLCVLSENSVEDAEFINGYAERLYRRINSPMPKRKPVLLDIESLKIIQDSIKNRIIRLAAKDAMGENYSLDRIHIDSVIALADKTTGAKAELPKGLVVSIKYGWLEFSKAEEEVETPDFCYEIEIGNKISNCEFDLNFKIVENDFDINKNQMILDYDILEGKKLLVRNRRKGDRMVFFKDGKTKKIKKYLIDKKIPQSERDKIPLLCADDEIVAIIGNRVAETYKINKNSKRGLVITYEQNYENR